MNFEKYSNAEEIEAIETEIKAIDPDLKIAWLSHSGDRCDAVGVYVTEKGNKKIINKLLELGFTKRRREKIRSIGYLYSEPTSFRVVLVMLLQGEHR